MGCFSGPKTTTTSNSTTDSKQNTTFNNQSVQSGSNNSLQTGQTSLNSTSTTNPNLPDWFMPYKQGVGQGFANLYSMLGQDMNKPLYGNAQVADYQQNLNRALGQNRQDLTSMLASQGALNSGRNAQVQTALNLGGTQQMQDFLANLPLLNQQNKQKLMGLQLGALQGAGNLTIPYGQTTTSNSVQDVVNKLLSDWAANGTQSGTQDQTGTQTTNGRQTQQTSGGFLNQILGGLISGGLGFLTGGMSNILGGGGFLSPSK